ncbi:ATP-dependent DNA helicase PIF1-like [Mercenaria mercenaria]|uniref:ATP-dependent DNA helicase PIF1-like n=1 Tax=Mercenaria mercenaria TaxID=6596 RepID=UPI00234ED1A4|nr:ATP-dependent DNA helicase PIF1-like [Mercenaria mercenaria]
MVKLFIPYLVDKYLNYASLSPANIGTLRRKFAGVHTVVIDEISMVSDRMLTVISRRLTEISGNNLPSGGFNIILFGDFFQIRPVSGLYAFCNRVLWELFKPLFLRENVRQNKDLRFIHLLNRARVGLLTQDDIELLKTCLDVNTVNTTSLCLFPTRSAVDKHNAQCLSRLQTEPFTIAAEHFFSSDDAACGGECESRFIPTDNRYAGGLPMALTVSIGSKVILIRNIDVSRGLVNGALGFVHSFISVNGRVTEVLVTFDDPFVGRSCNGTTNGQSSTPITIGLFEHQFTYCGRSITRRTFPLVLSYACTIHKVQGLTVDTCALDIGSSVFQAGMA